MGSLKNDVDYESGSKTETSNDGNEEVAEEPENQEEEVEPSGLKHQNNT